MNTNLNLSLTSIHAIAELENQLSDIEGYKIELHAIQPLVKSSKTIHEIKSVCSTILGSSIKDMESKTRKTEHVNARQLSMYFIKKIHPAMSLKNIGAEFGGRDHSTVIHAIQSVQDHCDVEKEYMETFNQINSILATPTIIN